MCIFTMVFYFFEKNVYIWFFWICWRNERCKKTGAWWNISWTYICERVCADVSLLSLRCSQPSEATARILAWQSQGLPSCWPARGLFFLPFEEPVFFVPSQGFVRLAILLGLILWVLQPPKLQPREPFLHALWNAVFFFWISISSPPHNFFEDAMILLCHVMYVLWSDLLM